jgi:signal transduction histidine kinase
MSHHRQARIAWALGALSLTLASGTLVFAGLGGSYRADLDSLPFLLACAIVGSLIASRRPENLVGWIMVCGALSFSLMSFTGYYALYGLEVQPDSVPAAHVVAWPQTWLWVVGAMLLYLLLPFYFPDGRPPSSKVQWLPGTVAIGGMAMALLAAFTPGDEFIQVQPEAATIVNPLGVTKIEAAVPAVLTAFLGGTIPVVIMGLLGVAVAAPVIRYRRAHGVQRQQLKWLAFSIAAFPILLAVDALIGLPSPILGLYLICIPLAIGIAVMRHNLYDIDLLINRALIYGALTAAVIGIYIFVVVYLGALLRTVIDMTGGTGWETTISLVATGVVAVLFQPMRDYVQRKINRLMYGERDEPYAVLSRLGQRLEASLATEAVLETIVETVREALRLPYAAILLRENERLVPKAASGAVRASPLRLPLTHQQEVVGELILGPRSAGEALGSADQRLLLDLARHIGTAAHNVQLTHQLVRANAELQRSREQLVLSAEEERRRLRRELHDGLGPTLAALNLKAGTIRDMMWNDREAAEKGIHEWRAEIRGTIASVRRLAYELRPPVLDELGLVAAIQERAMSGRNDRCRISVDAPDPLGPLPAAVEVAAFRIVQEALTNVERHAQARTCQVKIWRCDAPRASLHIQVVDDGVGTPAGEPLRAGVGMVSMQERAAELGGTCAVTNDANAGGLCLIAVLPLVEE